MAILFITLIVGTYICIIWALVLTIIDVVKHAMKIIPLFILSFLMICAAVIIGVTSEDPILSQPKTTIKRSL